MASTTTTTGDPEDPRPVIVKPYGPPVRLADRFPGKVALNTNPNEGTDEPYATGAVPAPPAATTPEEAPASGKKPRKMAIYNQAPTTTGGGSGGGTSGVTSTTATPPDFGFGDTILKGIQDLLANGSGFPLELLQRQLLESNIGQRNANEEALRRDAIRRGVYSSGITSSAIAKNRASAEADYSRGVTDLLVQKSKADYDARLQGLNLAQKYVDSARDWLLRSDANAIQLKIGMAQINLGYARLDLEREQLAKQGNGGGGGDSTAEILAFLQQAGLLGSNTPPQSPF